MVFCYINFSKGFKLFRKLKKCIFSTLIVLVMVFLIFCNNLSLPFAVYRNDKNSLKTESSLYNNRLIYNEGIKLENESIANILQKQVRILCLILTDPTNHYKKAIHVKNTWGKRCNVLLFMSSQQDNDIPTIALPVTEGYKQLWGKTKAAFQHVYDHYRDQADWFLKADDDTYVIVENLRHMLSAYSPQEPSYFGCRFISTLQNVYMSGGAGYVLSRAALDKFVEDGLPSKQLCKQSDLGMEDIEVGKCLEKLGVKSVDTRDSLGYGRFWPFYPELFLAPGALTKDNWFWNYTYYPLNQSQDAMCSRETISFHYIKPHTMYALDFLIYQLHPYGISNNQLQNIKEI